MAGLVTIPTMTMIAYYTIFMHFDGYWLVDSAMADAVIADPQRFSQLVAKAPTELAASRQDLAMGFASGARELHLKGAGVSHSVLTEIRRVGLVPVVSVGVRRPISPCKAAAPRCKQLGEALAPGLPTLRRCRPVSTTALGATWLAD